MLADNPWFVDSIHVFWHLKCPECTFDSKEEDIFQVHAIENHPNILLGSHPSLESFETSFISAHKIK